MDPIEGLARDDKWYLGSGDGILFAPPFPTWLDSPGFWDEATFYQYQVGPLFTVTWLDADGRELPLRVRSRRWTPAELTVAYDMGGGRTAVEVRSVQPRGVFASEWSVRSGRPGALHAVAWTCQDTSRLDLPSARGDASVSFVRRLSDRRDVSCDVLMELAAVGAATSWSVSLSERSAVHPHWRLAPFAEQWRLDRLPGEVRTGGVSTDGLLYAAVHAEVSAPPDHRDGSVAFAMRLAPLDPELRDRGGGALTPLGTAAIRAAAAEATPQVASRADGRGVTSRPLARASRRRWQEFFDLVPRFSCSDPYLERYYYYRWFGLHLNAVQGGRGNYRWPTVCEGIGFFHQPITYSAQCHVRELRWLREPQFARGVLRTIFDHQKANGGLHGRVYVNHLQGTDFYHADWGGALDALQEVHPSDAFAAEMYPRLARYAEWLLATRDRERGGMIDVVDQYETGQEYMSRYQAVDPGADAYGWENRIRLKGIDVTVYAYRLFRTLAGLAGTAGEPRAAGQWHGAAERTQLAVRGVMWNEGTGMFSDVSPVTGERTDVRAAACFYPYFTDMATEAHLAGLERNLLDPDSFWTEYPVPSSALDDPYFSAVAEWKGKRHACPWNGRVWPMTNSHVMEALGRWATPDRPHLREAAGRLLRRFVHMMFHEGDLGRPNCFEHYNPHTGVASVYRGIDDYQHSWVVDLIIRFACGLTVTPSAFVIDPLPLDLEAFELRGARVGGDEVGIRLDHGFLTVTVNDDLHMGPVGTPLVVPRR